MHAAQQAGQKKNWRGEDGSENDAEVNAVDERAVTVFAVAGAEGLGHESVEAHEKSCAEKSDHDEDVGAETDRGHGGGAVGEVADHDGVYDGHDHPAELGEDQR